MKLRQTILCFLVCISLSTYSQNKSPLALAKYESEKLLNYSACFLAKEKLETAIDKTDKSLESNYFDLGEAYRVLALINYEIGFTRQYISLVDSMYFYKEKLNQPIYYVEYAAYRLRGYAMDHNYAPALILIDSAKQVLKNSTTKAYLIDTLFFKLNEYNIYRNKRPNTDRKQNEIANWKDFKEYEKINWESQENPFKLALYYRYLGNIMQDLVYYRPKQYSNEVADSAIIKAIYYYEKGRALIIDTLGFDNLLSSRMNLMLAHQYSKNTPQIEKCLKVYSETMKGLTLSINGIDYFRVLSLSLSAGKMQASNLINFNQNNQYERSITRLNRLWKTRRLFMSQFLKQSPDKLFEGYSGDTKDELLNLYFSKLPFVKNYHDSLQIIENIWDIQSILYEPANYLETVKRNVGVLNFENWNRRLDSIQLVQQKFLDELFLIQKGIVDSKNETQITQYITDLEIEYDDYLKSKPLAFQRFQNGETQQSLTEIQLDLEEDEAILVQFELANIILLAERKTFSLIIKKNKIELVENKILKSKYDWTKTNAIDIQSIYWKQASYSQYYNYFYSAHNYLKDKKRIKLFLPPRYSLLNFDYFISDTTFANLSNAPFLTKEFAFTYTQNPSVDYLNSLQEISSNRNGVFLSDCESQQKNYKTPFIHHFANAIEKFFTVEKIKSKQELFSKDKNYRTFQSFSHGQVDSLFYINDHIYVSQNKYDHNYILACDEGISITDIDSINIKADFALIVSCNSGSGFVDNASAKFDFSKALIKNGSKTVVTASHEIDDQATAIILNSFYENIVNGDYTSVALQKAKLKYLSQIEDEELYKAVYWAGLKVNGIDAKYDIAEESDWFLGGGLGVFAILLIAGLWKWRYFSSDLLSVKNKT